MPTEAGEVNPQETELLEDLRKSLPVIKPFQSGTAI